MDLKEKVKEYYRSRPYKKALEQAKTIGKLFSELPFVIGVFGLGYPFYGDYDVIHRIEHSPPPEKSGILPDIDLLLVYSSDDHPQTIDGNFLLRVYRDFETQCGKHARQWNRLYSKLMKEHNIANRNKDLVKEFEKGKIHIDILPVPLPIFSIQKTQST
ncbi:MAG: hypothetical protein J7K68_02010 [Candidatus Diapherotrites archaeon]|nr:hypothetical protein [Candidatus Diapherotrites archaeon]